MLKVPNPLSRLIRIGLAPVLAPLTLGIAMLTAAVAPAKAIPVYQGGAYIRVGQTYPVYPRTFIYNAPPTSTIIYSNSSPSNLIYGSPIPSPVPLNQGTVIYHSDSVYNVNQIGRASCRERVYVLV